MTSFRAEKKFVDRNTGTEYNNDATEKIRFVMNSRLSLVGATLGQFWLYNSTGRSGRGRLEAVCVWIRKWKDYRWQIEC